MHGTSMCHENADCSNTEGSFTCTCHIGYQGNGFMCEGKVLAARNQLTLQNPVEPQVV